MKLCIIGGGNMGSALAKGALAHGLLECQDLAFIEHGEERTKQLVESFGCRVESQIESGSSTYDLIVVAVKPQDFSPVAAALAQQLEHFGNPTVVSVMAGVTLDVLQRSLGGYSKVVRSMPNMPAQIQEGVTIFISAEGLGTREREQVRELFSATGIYVEVDDEQLLDSGVALSGSGPGYLFYLVEHYCSVAKELGFTAEQARDVVYNTLHGALNQWIQLGVEPAELRQRVTSKGGTTEAALAHFQKNRLGEIFAEGIRKARERSVELSRGGQV